MLHTMKIKTHYNSQNKKTSHNLLNIPLLYKEIASSKHALLQGLVRQCLLPAVAGVQ